MATTPLSGQVQTVPNVDVEKYAGTWYEIASYPQRFQKGCTCTTAEYTLTSKGYLSVVNKCKRNGKLSSIKGKAFIEKNTGNAKLKVQFFWPFRAKYWIIDLASDYSYAVVSHPSKKYLWILSRTPVMNEPVYKGIIERLQRIGFDLKLLTLTLQS